MGRRIGLLLIAVIFTVILIVPCSYAGENNVSADKQRITVQDDVPDFTIYCEEYSNVDIDNSNIEVQMRSGKEEIINSVKAVDTFKNNTEGITYFLLIDTSKSMDYYSDESFESVKRAIVKFAEKHMDSKDKVFVLPFSEKGNYDNKVGINPTTDELKTEIGGLEADGNKSNIYDALGETVKIAEKIEKDSQYPSRKVAMLFTDACEFNDGGDEATAADVEMVSSGVTLHAFTIGNKRTEKNELKKFVVKSGGTVFDGKLSEDMNSLQKILDETLVISTTVKNPSDLVNDYSVEVYDKDILIGKKTNIDAPNTIGAKDAFSIIVKKMVMQFWWIILIAAIAVIALIVLLVIRRNKGIVNVGGKVVYGKNLQRKYHVKAKDRHVKELTMRVSVKGGKAIQQEITMVESLIVGRASLCDLYFDDAKMSRQHFAIEMIEGQLYIKDLNSTSGTYLNGVKVYMKQKLSSGDIVTAGTTRIAIEWK